MNIYSKKQQWKWALLIVAVFIVITSLWYTNKLVNGIKNDEEKKIRLWAEAVQKKAGLVKFTNDLFQKLQIEERKKAELYALATKQLSADEFSVSEFVLKVLQDNTTVPVILTDDQNNITASRNLDSTIENNKDALKKELETMKALYEPVVIDVYRGKKNYLYHKDSRLFSDIRVVFDSLIKSFISDVAINSAAVPVIYTDYSKTTIIAVGKSVFSRTNFKLALDIQPFPELHVNFLWKYPSCPYRCAKQHPQKPSSKNEPLHLPTSFHFCFCAGLSERLESIITFF